MPIREEACYDNPSLHHYFYNGIDNFKVKMLKPDRNDLFFKECNYDYNIWYEKSYDLHFGKPYQYVEDTTLIDLIKRETGYEKL